MCPLNRPVEATEQGQPELAPEGDVSMRDNTPTPGGGPVEKKEERGPWMLVTGNGTEIRPKLKQRQRS